MKKISTMVIRTILTIIVMVTLVLSASSIAVVYKQVSEDTQTYLETYTQQIANEVNSNFSVYEAITATMAQYLNSIYDPTRIKDNEYNQEILEKLKPFVLSVNEEYDELLSVLIALNTNLTEKLYIGWSSGEELKGYATEENITSTHRMVTDLNNTVADGKSAWSAPYYDDVIDATCMTYLVPVVIDGVSVGIAGIDINYDEFTGPIKNVEVYNSGSAFLVNSKQEFVVDDEYTSEQTLMDVGLSDLATEIAKGNKSMIKTKIDGTEYYITYGTLTNEHTLGIRIPVSEVKSVINKQVLEIIRNSIMLGIILIIIASVLSYLMSKKLTVPISKVTEDLKEMSNNNWTSKEHSDFMSYENEIGVLANSLNSLQLTMNETVTTVSSSSNEISNVADKLENSADILGDKVNKIDTISMELSESMQETEATANSLNKIANNMLDQVANMKQKNEDGLKVVSSIKDKVKVLCEQSEKDAANVEKMSLEVEKKLKETINDAKEVNQVNDLIEAILDISNQTNLLALNASIEAARAGESGRGFAVVASEISELATNSKEVAERIQSITSGVVDSVEKLCDTSNEVLQFVEVYLKQAYGQLSKMSDQYNVDTSNISNIFDEIIKLTHIVLSDIDTVTKSSEELKVFTSKGANGTSQVVNNVEEILQATMNVKDEIDNLSSVSENLYEKVNKFIV